VRFRIADVLTLWRSGTGFIATLDQGAFPAVAARHFALAWPLPGAIGLPVAVGFAVACLLAVAAPFLPPRRRHIVWALLAPPVSLAVAYQFSLGAYSNYHLGYGLLSHFCSAWAVAACVGAVAIVLPRAVAAVWENAARVGSVLLLLIVAIDLLRPASWSAIARSQVDFDRYMQQVTALFPDRASVWSGLTFGLASGTRLDLVEFSHGAALAFEHPAEHRGRISPDFLVINDLMRHVSFAMVHARSAAAGMRAYPQPLDYLPSLFPRQPYGLVALVDAPPYGTTRVYVRQDDRQTANAPMIAINDGSSPQWAKAVGAPIPFTSAPAGPALFRLSFIQTVEAAADRSRVVRLPGGTYLISVSVDRPAADRVGLIVATPAARFVGTAGDLGFRMAQAPYFAHERLVHLIVHHAGGPLYFSQFDANPAADFAIASVQPVKSLQPSREPIPLPSPDSWQLVGNGRSATLLPDGRLHVVGHDVPFSYQLASPPVAIPPDGILHLSAELDVVSGSAAIGLLDGEGRWLVPPVPARPDVEVAAGTTGSVAVVVVGIDVDQLAKPVEFVLGRVSLAIARAGTGQYTRRLAACRLAGGAAALRCPP
jgi:hypothetical protein